MARWWQWDRRWPTRAEWLKGVGALVLSVLGLYVVMFSRPAVALWETLGTWTAQMIIRGPRTLKRDAVMMFGQQILVPVRAGTIVNEIQKNPRVVMLFEYGDNGPLTVTIREQSRHALVGQDTEVAGYPAKIARLKSLDPTARPVMVTFPGLSMEMTFTGRSDEEVKSWLAGVRRRPQ